MSAIIAANFFSAPDESTRNIFVLLAFAAGFAVRPFGALVFGRRGDMIGCKYTFLITILIMGLSTFLVAFLPTYKTAGIAAPIALIALRMFQGLALMVILGTRTYFGEEDFVDWAWRIPYAMSGILLAVSVWIRLKLNESPAFSKMKAEGKTSKAPLSESFGQWKNLKIVILALARKPALRRKCGRL